MSNNNAGNHRLGGLFGTNMDEEALLKKLISKWTTQQEVTVRLETKMDNLIIGVDALARSNLLVESRLKETTYMLERNATEISDLGSAIKVAGNRVGVVERRIGPIEAEYQTRQENKKELFRGLLLPIVAGVGTVAVLSVVSLFGLGFFVQYLNRSQPPPAEIRQGELD